MSVPVRLFATAGFFITAIFYRTEKVVVMNITSAVLSVIGCFWMYASEEERGTVWCLILNPLLAIVQVALLPLFSGQTGIALMDNHDLFKTENLTKSDR